MVYGLTTELNRHLHVNVSYNINIFGFKVFIFNNNSAFDCGKPLAVDGAVIEYENMMKSQTLESKLTYHCTEGLI